MVPRQTVSFAFRESQCFPRWSYIWIWSGAHDQESTNHNACFSEWKSWYWTIFFIVFPEKMYWLTFCCFHFLLLLIFQDPFKYRNVLLLRFFCNNHLLLLWVDRSMEDTADRRHWLWPRVTCENHTARTHNLFGVHHYPVHSWVDKWMNKFTLLLLESSK